MKPLLNLSKPRPTLSGLRILGLSASLAIHVALVLMLLLPATPVPEPEVDDDRVEVILIEPPPIPPPPPPPPPMPDPPKRPPPKEIIKPEPRPAPPPPPAPVILDTATPMSTPAPPPTPPAPPAPAPLMDYAASEDPSYRKMRPPRYPPQAVRKHEEGEVLLRVLVGTDGTPLEIKIQRSSRSRLLDRAAVDAVEQWRFNPAMKQGVLVQSWVLVPILFSLRDV